MLEKIIDLDKSLFVFLNNLGSKPFDDIWLLMTKQFNWIPFFLILLYILFKKIGQKKILVVYCVGVNIIGQPIYIIHEI